MALYDEIIARNPIAYWRFGEGSMPGSWTSNATAADEVGAANGLYKYSGQWGQQSLDVSSTDTCIISYSASYVQVPSASAGSVLGACDGSSCSVFLLLKNGNSGWPGGAYINAFYFGSGWFIRQDTAGEISMVVAHSNTHAAAITSGAALDDQSIHSALLVYDDAAKMVTVYIDGIEAGYLSRSTGVGTHTPSTSNVTLADSLSGWADEQAIFNAVLGSADAVALHAAATTPAPTPTGASTLPMRLTTDSAVTGTVLPMRLLGGTATAGTVLPMRLESADPAHFTAGSARWALAVSLAGSDISTRLDGVVTIEDEANASSQCDLAFLPPVGAIDPADYENTPLRVSFVGQDSAGGTLYTVQQFTGMVESASYNPDDGLMQITGTNDLQGWLEQQPRAVLAAAVGGQWSQHVFDDTADGYQYALDRLSTQPASMYLDHYGRFQITPWAAAVTPDFTFTDSARFDDTLQLDRANRRDLISRFRINLDFRFVRLRHRQISATFVNQLGLCHYLDNNWKLPTKDMVRSAADGTEWTRIGDIAWVELPPTGEYCLGRNWLHTALVDDFCLGASWKAARRWAQTVTEQYALEVSAPDLVATAGDQLLSEDYGIEATYDATDYERSTDFSTAPAGGTYSAETQDWMLEATAAESDGRVAMATAQACVLARAETAILDRARRNRLTFSPLFRPDVTLAHTARVVTPGLIAKGKVTAIRREMNPRAGALDMSLTLALSRHSGSGLPASDTLDPAPTPPPPAEVPTPRIYSVGYHVGSTAFSPPDDPDWDGYVLNVGTNGVLYDAAGPVYRERFSVAMPEIEAAARDAVAAQQAQTYQVQVPNDELTLSA